MPHLIYDSNKDINYIKAQQAEANHQSRSKTKTKVTLNLSKNGGISLNKNLSPATIDKI